jgi:hypothetical protein
VATHVLLKDSEKQITIRIVVCDRSLGQKQKYFFHQQMAQLRSWEMRQERNLTSLSPTLMSVY